MAAIEESGDVHGNGKVRSKKISTRVDMTPMVDLGFLLITFFMLATTITKPSAMSVFFPAKDPEPITESIRASGVLTLFLCADREVYYLDGIAATDTRATSELKRTDTGSDLRRVIFASQKRVAAISNGKKSLVVVIKPTAVSNYKSMVDVMDEMAITRSTRYALVDKLTDPEKKVLGEKLLPVK